jgi:hypothetical protein
MVTVALLGWLSAVAPTADRPQPLRTLLFDVAVAEWGRLSVGATLNAARQDQCGSSSRA